MLDLKETRRRVQESSRSVLLISEKLRDAYGQIERQKAQISDLEALLKELLEALENQRSEFFLENGERPSPAEVKISVQNMREILGENGRTREVPQDQKTPTGLPAFKRLAGSVSAS